MKRAFILANTHFFKHIGTIKFWAPLVIALSAACGAAIPLARMTAEYKTSVNGFMAAFMFSDKLTTFVIFLGFYVLIADLPLKDSQQNFLLIRSGKRAWIFSQVIYILYITAIYFAFVLAAFFTALLPKLGFDPDNWGKIARACSVPSAQGKFLLRIRASQSALSDYTPIEAFGYGAGMALFIALALGILALTLNLIFKNKSGTVVVGVLIFLVNFVDWINAVSIKAFYISPLGWCSLNNMDKNGTSVMPDFSYATGVTAAVTCVCVIALAVYGNKRGKFNLN